MFSKCDDAEVTSRECEYFRSAFREWLARLAVIFPMTPKIKIQELIQALVGDALRAPIVMYKILLTLWKICIVARGQKPLQQRADQTATTASAATKASVPAGCVTTRHYQAILCRQLVTTKGLCSGGPCYHPLLYYLPNFFFEYYPLQNFMHSKIT